VSKMAADLRHDAYARPGSRSRIAAALLQSTSRSHQSESGSTATAPFYPQFADMSGAASEARLEDPLTGRHEALGADLCPLLLVGRGEHG
jgi:hypothetical protein